MATLTKAEKKDIELVSDKVASGQVELTDIIDYLQEKYDNHSEKWQESERGEELNDLIYQLEDWRDSLEEISGELFDLSQE